MHFPVLCDPPLYQIRQSCRHQRCSPTVPHCGFNFSHKWPTFAFTGESGYTLAFRRKIAHKGTHGETGAFRMGGRYHYPQTVLRGSETLRGRDLKRHTLPLWDLGREVLSKNAESLRDSDAHDARRCSEGVAAPLGCVIFFRFCRNYGFHTLRSRLSVCARGVVSLPSACFACC